MKEIIEARRKTIRKVFLVTDSIGKEEAFIALAMYFKTKIILNEERYTYIEQIFEEKTSQLFTKEGKGWIEVIKRGEKEQRLMKEKSISILMTGWANIRDYQQISNQEYVKIGLCRLFPTPSIPTTRR